MEFVGFTFAKQSLRRTDGGRHGSPFPPVVQEDGRRPGGVEMVTSNSLLYGSADACAGPTTSASAPISVQIAGADPQMMAQAARHNVDNGAQIIDINMGCPAKKVCNVMAGSALMQDEKLVGQILDAVVGAIPDTPVTLKFRTGWNLANKNAPTIARIANRPASVPSPSTAGRAASNTPARPSTTPSPWSRP